MSRYFTIAKYRLTLEAGEKGLLLPPYKGSTLRGGFGNAFRRISCALKEANCNNCLLRTSCPYAYIFETAPPPGSAALRNYESIPRPFVLEPPLETKTEYRPGEKLAFNLILIGRATNYLPYFIVAFRELGELGIGKMRRKYRLAEIQAVGLNNGESQLVYQAEDQLVRNTNLAIQIDQAELLRQKDEDKTLTRLGLDFLTITRIKFEENYVHHIELHMLIRSLLRRLSSLAYFHHGWELELDFTGLIERAAEVRLVSDGTRWVDWERYSSRQDNKVNMGGLVGMVEYEGCLDEFLPLLRIGELVHVGKGAVFGMGKYEFSDDTIDKPYFYCQ
jgi:hypothetical protein